MNHILLCEHCKDVIVKSIGDDVKIRGKLLLFKDNTAFVVCKGCDAEVEVPVKLDYAILKSMVDRSQVYHYLKR